MEESINKLLAEIKIEEVIQDYVSLKKRGSNYLGICPFHQERTPSFTVSPSKQIYKCFGCGKSGNAISFLIEYKKCDFKTAINHLLEKYNLPKIAVSGQNEEEFEIDSIVATTIKPIMLNLDANFSSVFDLVKFDRILLDLCIGHLEALEERIKNNDEIKITQVSYYPGNTLTMLRNVKQNDSMKLMYGSMYNQGVVLIISYLTSSIKELFIRSLNYWASHKTTSFNEANTEFKITLDELRSLNFNLSNSIGDLIIKKKNISFQDMQSTLREFETYFGFKTEKDEFVDNVILGQAARHAIVHSLAIADEKFINQVSDAKLRTLKTDVSQNDDLKFTIEELEQLSNSCKKFFRHLVDSIISRTK